MLNELFGRFDQLAKVGTHYCGLGYDDGYDAHDEDDEGYDGNNKARRNK